MIKEFNFYRQYAKDFAKNELGQELNIPVIKKNTLSTLGEFRYYKSPFLLEKRKGTFAIYINVSEHDTHEQLIGTIKHEVIHWFCYRNHLGFNDGDKDFETMLFKHDAPSTEFGNNGKAQSKSIQSKIMNGQVNKKGIEGTQYRKCNAEDFYHLIERNNQGLIKDLELEVQYLEKSYEVYFENEFIGYVFFLNRDKWVKQWIVVKADGTENNTKRCNTRKKAVLPYIFNHQAKNNEAVC